MSLDDEHLHRQGFPWAISMQWTTAKDFKRAILYFHTIPTEAELNSELAKIGKAVIKDFA